MSRLFVAMLMDSPARAVSALVLAFGLGVLPDAFAAAPAPQTQPPVVDAAKPYNEAMVAFQAGDFATVVEKLEMVIAQAGKGAQLESVYFTLGAAYFNLEKYPK